MDVKSQQVREAVNLDETMNTSFRVIGVGASAGGLESLQEFFGAVAPDSNCAFLVVQHLSADFKSFMPEILARSTELPVQAAEDGLPLEPRRIYLGVPGKELRVEGGLLKLREAQRTHAPSAVDQLFLSIAQNYGTRAAAVVLSGAGSDGSRGVRAISDAGGLLFVERPETAGFDGMPRAALAQGLVAHVGRPAELARAATTWRDPAEHKTLDQQHAAAQRAILQRIESQYGVDFTLYKLGTVGRRLERRCDALHLESLSAYEAYLVTHPEEVAAAYQELLIGVTRFFRDPEAFDALGRKAVAALMSSRRTDEELRVWVPGCSSGEEAYSVAMLLLEGMQDRGDSRQFRLFATDVDEHALQRASEGSYPGSAVAALPPALRERYFLAGPRSNIQVAPTLRRHVVFARHNILSDPPFREVDLVCCRNLMIYFTEAAQRVALSAFFFGLRDGGVLFLGPSEGLGRFEGNYVALDARWKIYQKVAGSRFTMDTRLPSYARPNGLQYVVSRAGRAPSAEERPEVGDALQALLQRFVPPSLLLNEQLDVVHTFGDAGKWLRPRPGSISTNLRNLAEERLANAASVSIQRVLRENAEVAYSGLQIGAGDAARSVELTMRGLDRPVKGARPLFFLATLRTEEPPHHPTTPRPTPLSARDLDHVQGLQAELESTKRSLQSTIEELESTNEELQAANEELVASNEELQSTNEELQSTNEELYTVNTEYQRKIDELTEFSQDESNLLRSTHTVAVFLDASLRIRKFTPAAAAVLGLLAHDVGRPLLHIAGPLRLSDHEAEMRRVLDTGRLIERELVDTPQGTFLLRICPYERGKETLGAILHFVDLAPVQAAKRELGLKESHIRMLQTLNDGYWDWDMVRDREYMSPRFWEMLGIDPNTRPHHPSAWMEVIHPADLEAARANLAQHIRTRGQHPYQQEVRYQHHDGSWIWVRCQGRVIEWGPNGEALRMVGTHTDISALKEVQEWQNLLLSGASVGLWDWRDPSRPEVEWSDELYRMLGYSRQELPSTFDNFMALVHPGDLSKFKQKLERHLKERAGYRIMMRLLTKSRGYRWFRASGQAHWAEDGRPLRMAGALEELRGAYRAIPQAPRRHLWHHASQSKQARLWPITRRSSRPPAF